MVKKPVETNWRTEEANSTGSMKELMKVWRPAVVLRSCKEEIYPEFPKPLVVERKLEPSVLVTPVIEETS